MTTVASPTLSFHRVLAVEFRKLVSTRSMQLLLGLSLAAIIGISVCCTVWHEALFSPAATQAPGWTPWIVAAFIIRLPVQLLLAAVVALHVTSEWGTRSAMMTFTLVPRRSWIISAKSLVALTAALAFYAAASAGGIASTWVGRNLAEVPHEGMWVTANDVARDLAGWLLIMGCAFGLALLLHSSALAIASALALPMVVQLIRSMNDTLRTVFSWVDLHGMIQQVINAHDDSHLPQLVVAATLWVVIPLVAGTWRTLRREAA